LGFEIWNLGLLLVAEGSFIYDFRFTILDLLTWILGFEIWNLGLLLVAGGSFIYDFRFTILDLLTWILGFEIWNLGLLPYYLMTMNDAASPKDMV
jgi:hypothetical protein